MGPDLITESTTAAPSNSTGPHGARVRCQGDFPLHPTPVLVGKETVGECATFDFQGQGLVSKW